MTAVAPQALDRERQSDLRQERNQDRGKSAGGVFGQIGASHRVLRRRKSTGEATVEAAMAALLLALLGLAELGREVLGARGVPVLGTPSMASFLRGNRPWSRLVAFDNIAIREIEPGVAV